MKINYYSWQVFVDHGYSTASSRASAAELQRLDDRTNDLVKQVEALKLEAKQRKPMTVHDIKDNDETVSLFKSFRIFFSNFNVTISQNELFHFEVAQCLPVDETHLSFHVFLYINI